MFWYLAALEKRAKTKPVSPYNRALLHAVLGEKDEAFRWLDEALEKRWIRNQANELAEVVEALALRLECSARRHRLSPAQDVGAALSAGVLVALACDKSYVSENATIGAAARTPVPPMRTSVKPFMAR